MRTATSFCLKVLALVLWAFVPLYLYTLLVLHFPNVLPFGDLFSHQLVRGEYRWDFELMFVTIYAVWGYFLWLAASEPPKHELFIRFSIWANVAHGAIMIVIGLLRSGEALHLLLDGMVLIVPALLLFAAQHKNKAMKPMSE